MAVYERRSLAGQRPDERHPAAGEGPREELRPVALPFRIDADLLEVVEQPGRLRPGRAGGHVEQAGDEHRSLLRRRLPEADGPIEPRDERCDPAGEALFRTAAGLLVCTGHPPQPPLEQRSPHVITPADGRRGPAAKIGSGPTGKAAGGLGRRRWWSRFAWCDPCRRV